MQVLTDFMAFMMIARGNTALNFGNNLQAVLIASHLVGTFKLTYIHFILVVHCWPFFK